MYAHYEEQEPSFTLVAALSSLSLHTREAEGQGGSGVQARTPVPSASPGTPRVCISTASELLEVKGFLPALTPTVPAYTFLASSAVGVSYSCRTLPGQAVPNQGLYPPNRYSPTTGCTPLTDTALDFSKAGSLTSRGVHCMIN